MQFELLNLTNQIALFLELNNQIVSFTANQVHTQTQSWILIFRVCMPATGVNSRFRSVYYASGNVEISLVANCISFLYALTNGLLPGSDFSM